MKKLIENQKRVREQLKKVLGPISKEEAEARRLWTLGYNKYQNAVKKLNERRKKELTTDPVKNGKTNQTVKALWDTLNGWDEKSKLLTEKRDSARNKMELTKEQIIKTEQSLEKLLGEYRIQKQETDGMINNVFLLNDGVVAALENMDKFLASEVFTKLSDSATRKTIENSDSTKKVVIMTNSINWMDVSKAEEAKELINNFFERINPKEDEEENDTTIQMLSELLKELLVVKIKVKAGPNLSKFLSLDIDKEQFPELVEAQKLLASATNYVRSGKYIRIYTREDKNEKWQPVRQSWNKSKYFKSPYFTGFFVLYLF